MIERDEERMIEKEAKTFAKETEENKQKEENEKINKPQGIEEENIQTKKDNIGK